MLLVGSGKGLKVMNLGGSQPTAGVPIMDSVVDHHPVDSYLVQIQNEAGGGEESDEEVHYFYGLR